MSSLSAEINGKQDMVSYRLKRVNGKLYLVKEWNDPDTGRKRTKSIGRVEWLEQLADEYKAKLDKRPYITEKTRSWCGGRDLNPGSPAWEAGVLVQARRPPLPCRVVAFYVWRFIWVAPYVLVSVRVSF